MAYEVTKTIGARSYRYLVESRRDPATGKRRNYWTYLGRAQENGDPAKPPRRRGEARERLLDALERLLETRDYGSLTADAIALEAGFAHGTFYRYFRDKRDALRAALERVRERTGPIFAATGDDAPDVDTARAAIARLVTTGLRFPVEHRALLRAYHLLSFRDEEFGRERSDRKRDAVARVERYLGRLHERGIVALDDPAAAAAALVAMIDGFYREAVVDGSPLDEQRVAGVGEWVQRAFFGAA